MNAKELYTAARVLQNLREKRAYTPISQIPGDTYHKWAREGDRFPGDFHQAYVNAYTPEGYPKLQAFYIDNTRPLGQREVPVDYKEPIQPYEKLNPYVKSKSKAIPTIPIPGVLPSIINNGVSTVNKFNRYRIDQEDYNKNMGIYNNNKYIYRGNMGDRKRILDHEFKTPSTDIENYRLNIAPYHEMPEKPQKPIIPSSLKNPGMIGYLSDMYSNESQLYNSGSK